MRTYDPNQPAIFTHMPKCAGSSFIRLLRQWFGDEYHKLNQDETQDILLPRIDTRDEHGNWLPNVKCIHGHFDTGRGYGLPYFYPEINQYFTVLRDPFDIAVSMFFFCKKRSAEGKFWYRGRQENILDKYPDVEYYLKEFPYWIYNHLPQDITLQNYEQRLAERFIYIGIQEDLNTSIERLGRILGMPYVELERFNESKYDEPVPEWLRDRFYTDYPLLNHIYQFALQNYKREDLVWFADRKSNESASVEEAKTGVPCEIRNSSPNNAAPKTGHFHKAGRDESAAEHSGTEDSNTVEPTSTKRINAEEAV